MTHITLQEVNQSNWHTALQLDVEVGQKKFVSEIFPVAAIALAKAYICPWGMKWLPYAIYSNTFMVGFFELAYVEDSHDACWMFHFFIDKSYQGQGYGKQALDAIIHLITTINFQKICLTVHPENLAAQHLYTQAGFQTSGKIRNNEPIYELII